MILHITNDYSGSTVYKNLIRELDLLNIAQIIYNPIRERSRINKNSIEFKNENSKIIYSHILTSFSDRILYQKKIDKIVCDIESKIDLSKIKFIHAHTWYSDGGVAYELHLKYKIPYIVAIRNTDLNLFLKYFIHKRNYGKKILLAADKVITISTIYKQRMLNDIRLASIINNVKNKLMIIPNGVDPFWIESRVSARKNIYNKNNIRLLYVGKFDKGKNVFNLITAIKLINNDNNIKITLTLVGGTGNDEKRILKTIKNDNSFNYVGKVLDLYQLRNYYQENDFFAMPSKAETFGLVYIEALLQGLPILYTKNEGIDGFYDDSIGEKVDNISVKEIQKKLTYMISQSQKYNFDIDRFSDVHDWRKIAKTYSKLYKTIK